jgi:tripartite-type tricarboxylate transporter receptor subunit TctC
MNRSRRRVLQGLLSAAVPVMARAEAYPSRTIKLVMPYPAGGGPDVLTRQFLPRLSALLGQTVYIDNKVGAGGLVAAEHVAKQAPDGYTLLVGASTHLTQKALQPKLPFDPVKDFTHVTRLSLAPSLLVVAAASPYRSVDEILRDARAAPGKLNYGSGGIGSAAHLAGAALAQQAQVAFTHVPYRGSVDLPLALISGDVHFAIPTASTVLPFIVSGKLRALAITSAQRMALLPAVPTLKELTGSDELVLVAWSGLWLPAGAPAHVVKTLFEAHAKLYAEADVVKAHAAVGVSVALSASPGEFHEFVAAEMAKTTRLVKAAHLEVG